jgi:Tol biopolymer transport system component
MVVLSNDGKWLATRAQTGEGIRLRRLEQEGYRELDLGDSAEPLCFSPDGRWLLASRGDNELLKVPVEGGAPIPITRSAFVLAADWAEDDRIVFTNLKGTFLVSANDGEQEVVREQGVGYAWDIKWLPGGNHVIYASGPIGAPRGEIHVLDLETGESQRVIEDGFSPRYTSSGHLFFLRGDQTLNAVPFHPGRAEDMGQTIPVLDSVVVFSVGPNGLYDVSDVGTLAYFRGPPIGVGSEESRVVFVDRSGSQEMTPVPAGQLQHPRLSPDGQRLAYRRNARAYVYEFLDGDNNPITPADQVALFPTWSRDGSRIAAFTLFGGGGGGTADVFSAEVHGPPTTVAAVEGRVVLPLGWTPNDDGLLVFIDGLSGGVNSDLAIVRFGSDTTLVPYLQADWNEGPGALSPDGRWVVYASDESGEDRLYVRSFPEKGPRHDLSPPGIDVNGLPVWARDGSTIFWRSGDSMMASEVAAEVDFRAGPARLLFVGNYGPNFDVTEDGRFVMITAPESDSTEAGGEGEPESEHRTILVVNWLEGVKARLTEGGNR